MNPIQETLATLLKNPEDPVVIKFDSPHTAQHFENIMEALGFDARPNKRKWTSSIIGTKHQ